MDRFDKRPEIKPDNYAFGYRDRELAFFRNRWKDADDIRVTISADAYTGGIGWDTCGTLGLNLLAFNTRFFGQPDKGGELRRTARCGWTAGRARGPPGAPVAGDGQAPAPGQGRGLRGSLLACQSPETGLILMDIEAKQGHDPRDGETLQPAAPMRCGLMLWEMLSAAEALAEKRSFERRMTPGSWGLDAVDGESESQREGVCTTQSGDWIRRRNWL